jgi:predicted MFS family arabinose efflux permease
MKTGGKRTIFIIIVSQFACTSLWFAGIYPVGMKIASDYSQKGLGKALGYLVGALVLGTSFGHLLKTLTQGLDWKYVIYFTSGITILGGLAIFLFVPDGPCRKPSAGFDFAAFYKVFKISSLRRAAFGYFGHMWELYSFWAFTPFILLTYLKLHAEALFSVPTFSFIVIASGGLSCAIGGYFSGRFGSAKVAFAALLFSCICCLISPFVFQAPAPIFLGFLVFWGMAVVADSPQFSALVAGSAPDEFKGTALTIVNSIGFAITIVSIEVFNALMNFISPQFIYLVLAIGPIVGMAAMYKRTTASPPSPLSSNSS